MPLACGSQLSLSMYVTGPTPPSGGLPPLIVQPFASAFWIVYCPSATAADSSGRVADVATVGPAACCGAVPAGVGPPVGPGAQSIPDPASTGPSAASSVTAASSTPPSGATSVPDGTSVACCWSDATSCTPVSGVAAGLPPPHADV